jgi:hypothetical protein
VDERGFGGKTRVPWCCLFYTRAVTFLAPMGRILIMKSALHAVGKINYHDDATIGFELSGFIAVGPASSMLSLPQSALIAVTVSQSKGE